jgi:hypothetical protein
MSQQIGTSKNVRFVHGGRNAAGKQMARRSTQARESTPFLFNTAGHTVSLLFIVPCVLFVDVFQSARNEDKPYLSANEIFERSRFYNGVDTFKDVHNDDFVVAVGRVGRRQLRWLDLDPYPAGLLKCGLGQRVQEKGVSSEVLQGMEYTGAVRVMLATDMANINKRVDEVKEEVETMGKEVDELLAMRQEVMELGAELTEARGEAEECRGAMMFMRNALTDVTREFQDFRAQWTEQREVLIQICSGLLGRLEVVEGLVGPGSAERPIVIKDSEDSRNDGDMETAAGSFISLWVRDVASTADNTLVDNPMVYELVLIEELARSE